MVQSYLEFYVQFWSLHLKGDAAEFKQIHKRTSKMNIGLEHLPYKEKL